MNILYFSSIANNVNKIANYLIIIIFLPIQRANILLGPVIHGDVDGGEVADMAKGLVKGAPVNGRSQRYFMAVFESDNKGVGCIPRGAGKGLLAQVIHVIADFLHLRKQQPRFYLLYAGKREGIDPREERQ